ncbi:MAG: hypothetical protein ABIH21_02640 [Patescibacteria group bacterium]
MSLDAEAGLGLVNALRDSIREHGGDPRILLSVHEDKLLMSRCAKLALGIWAELVMEYHPSACTLKALRGAGISVDLDTRVLRNVWKQEKQPAGVRSVVLFRDLRPKAIDIWPKLERLGLRSATMLEFCIFAMQYPEEVLHHAIYTFGYLGGFEKDTEDVARHSLRHQFPVLYHDDQRGIVLGKMVGSTSREIKVFPGDYANARSSGDPCLLAVRLDDA